MKFRIKRVSEVIKRELGDIIPKEVKFKAKLVTVQHVDLTPDLKQCHVYVSAIGTKEEQHEAIAALVGHRKELQKALSRRVIIKYTPHLHFELDDSIVRGNRVIDILQQIEPTLPPMEEEASSETAEKDLPDFEEEEEEEVLPKPRRTKSNRKQTTTEDDE
jgi:ribosome-binding factor A